MRINDRCLPKNRYRMIVVSFKICIRWKLNAMHVLGLVHTKIIW